MLSECHLQHLIWSINPSARKQRKRGNCFSNITVIFHNILYFRTNGNLKDAAIILVLNIAIFKWPFIFQSLFNSIKICTDLHHRELSPVDAMNKQTYLSLPLLGGLHPFHGLCPSLWSLPLASLSLRPWQPRFTVNLWY